MDDDTGKTRILVVDDEDLVREACKAILSAAGFGIDTAGNGIEALHKLADSAYALMVSDMEMPFLDGIGLYLRVKEDYPYLKERFLFITGCSGTARELSGMGIMALAKPFSPHELLGSVRGILHVSGGPAPSEAKRRREARFAKAAACRIAPFHDGHGANQEVEARVEDISERGMKLRCPPEITLGSGMEVSVLIGNSGARKAKVVWTMMSGGFSLSGLSLAEPVPASAIAAM